MFAKESKLFLRNCFKNYFLGNGPSGISLSNMLSGNVPYFSGKFPSGSRINEGISVFDKCQQNLDLSIIQQVCGQL